MAPTLIPDLDELYNCPFYWGKIEEEEAKAVLKDKPFGSYLIRDTEEAVDKIHQLELFFVGKYLSICKMALHFDLNCAMSNVMYHVPIGGIIKFGSIGRKSFMAFLRDLTKDLYHILIYPVVKNTPFSLQELARSNIRKTAALSFDGISQLELPEKLKKFLKEHYMCSLTDDANYIML